MTDQEIGARIRDLREGVSVQQGAFAERLREAGLPWSQGTLSRVESGRRPVRLVEAPLLADQLGVSIDDLLGGATESRADTVLIERQRQAIEAVRTDLQRAIDRLDGTVGSAVSLLTGLSSDELENLGGFSESEAADNWSTSRIRALGATTDIKTASAILGMGQTAGYALARRGEFPVKVLTLGRKYVIPVAGLLTALGID